LSSYTPLGYQADPPPSITLVPAPETLARRIDAAVAEVPADRRGTLILRADRQHASLDFMVRVSSNVIAVARVSKPWTGPAEAEAMIRVNFAVAVSEIPELRLGFGDYYHALRAKHEGVKRNSKFRALVKALAIRHLKQQPYLDGGRWFGRG
jgi:hypothetical protein